MLILQLEAGNDVLPVHCDLGDSVDADSHRFIDDLERFCGREIVRIRSEQFANVDEVFEKAKFLSSPNGARCTGEMKIVPRMNFQCPSDIHLFGYAYDRRDIERHKNLRINFPFMKYRSPLIEERITKAQSHGIIAERGIRRPRVYDLGFPNGNCIGCVKAGSPGYWAIVRLHWPEVFARRADQSRRFNARLVQYKGKRIYLDELPANVPPVVRGSMGGCGFHCNGGK